MFMATPYCPSATVARDASHLGLDTWSYMLSKQPFGHKAYAPGVYLRRESPSLLCEIDPIHRRCANYLLLAVINIDRFVVNKE